MMSFGGNNDISSIFSHPLHPERNQEREEERPEEEFVLEKTGDSVEGPVYEGDPAEREEELIPEEPVKKERPKKDTQESKDNSPKFSVTAKIGYIDKDFLTDIEDAFGINTSQALVKCIEFYREANGDGIRNDAKKIRRIRNKQ